jgi:hypothetical protein
MTLYAMEVAILVTLIVHLLRAGENNG